MPAVNDTRLVAQGLLDFVAASPSPFHAAEAAGVPLGQAGFRRLDEAEAWDLEPGGKYFAVRNGSSVVAFIVGDERPESAGLRVVGTHLDSPALKLKPQPVIERHGYVQLGIEVYGGTLLNSWLDRDLGLAGRVVVESATPRRSRAAATLARGRGGRGAGRRPAAARGLATRGAGARDAGSRDAGARGPDSDDRAAGTPGEAGDGTMSLLLRVDTPFARVPQLAIHLDREVNDKGLILNKESHLVPVIGLSGARGFDFRGWLGERLGVSPARVLDHDLFFYDLATPSFLGLDAAFLSAPRLDNLAGSHAALSALLATAGERSGATRVAALYDNEEIGSSTRQGAGGPFLVEVIDRVVATMGASGSEARHRTRARSLLVSADMAHALHPNYPDRNEPRHAPRLNGGPVIKYNANARYATDAVAGAFFAKICREAKVPFQRYVNRADLVCGSTIGPLVSTQLGLRTVDVGSPMLAMHSCREMAGALDPAFMVRAMRRFYVS
jgi:aspartyl aminopeptidase